MLKRREPTVASTQASEQASWTVARAEDEGKPLMIGVNAAYRDVIDRDQYPVRVSVALIVNEPTEQGWPRSDEGHQLQDAEDTILRVVRGRAALVGRVTGRGAREFIFYTDDEAWLDGLYRDLDAAVTSHAVEMMAEPDPEWEAFHSLLPRPKGPSTDRP